MCLILFALRAHPSYPLVLAANRDEFFERPTQRVHYWTPDHPSLLAGRDLRSGGTWLGVTRSGRFAAITNYRELDRHQPDAPSRGHLVADFLKGTQAPMPYLEHLAKQAEEYNGFNLLVGTPTEMAYFSNRGSGPRRLPDGIYGLSNHLLDTPWPKVQTGKAALTATLQNEPPPPPRLSHRLFQHLHDPAPAADADLPDTGVGLDWERVLSPLHIVSPTYGTRSASALLLDHTGRITLAERAYGLEGIVAPDHFFQFTVTS